MLFGKHPIVDEMAVISLESVKKALTRMFAFVSLSSEDALGSQSGHFESQNKRTA